MMMMMTIVKLEPHSESETAFYGLVTLTFWP